ncbi:MAG: LysR family transcriptional regulator [Candidatus Rokuibacteriota bacterium]
MTLRQLEVFLAIAHAHSYRQAAEALHPSQPALSQHVRELEAELGVRLFDRLSRGVVLTEAGGVLEERAKRVFATLTDARSWGSSRGSSADRFWSARARRRGSTCSPRSSERFGADTPGSTCGCGSPTRARSRRPSARMKWTWG